MSPQRALLLFTLAFSAACYDRGDGGARQASADSAVAAADAGIPTDVASAPDASQSKADAGCSCKGDTPVCLENGRCAECSSEDTFACPADKPLCNDAHECAACVEHSDCKADDAPTCSEGACVPCSTDEGCAQRGKICNYRTGQCVSCTVEREEERCGFNSCDPKTLACTLTRRASASLCEVCVADSECEADHRCIPMHFGTGAERVELGGRCLRRGAVRCEEPYVSAPIVRASLSGAPEEPYCGVAEDKTSCEAMLGLLRAEACPDGRDDSCPGRGALCRTVNGGLNRCTYACSSWAQCPTIALCPTSGAEPYCGK